jgi:hypothetical protein
LLSFFQEGCSDGFATSRAVVIAFAASNEENRPPCFNPVGLDSIEASLMNNLYITLIPFQSLYLILISYFHAGSVYRSDCGAA